jgi:flagellar hook-length control protein FliK
VSQVASDPTIHAHNPQLPRPTRPPQPSDRAPSPFESLLDDGTQAADPSAPPPPGNKAASTDGTQAPAKANDCKAPAANDTTTTKPEDETPAEKPDDGKPVCDTKAAATAQLAEGATTGDGSKPESDKPADGPKADKPAVTASTTIVQTTSPADAIAVAPPPTPISTPVPDQDNQDGEPQQIALSAETGLQMKSLDAGMPKSIAGKQSDTAKPANADKQVDGDQSVDQITDGSQPTTKATPETHADKPQFTISESDKTHVADARGELPMNGHHGSSEAPALAPADSSTAAPKIIADTGAQTTITATQTQPTTNTAVPAALVSQPGELAAPIPLSGVAIEIAGKALAGKNRFDIRLDPPELGRIEVRLDVDRDGNVTSRLTVDRADTLDLLRRDASGLERALQDAGLKTADNSLQFQLRDQSMGQQQTGGGPDTAQMIVTDETPPSIDIIPQNYGRLAGTGGGLDIRV